MGFLRDLLLGRHDCAGRTKSGVDATGNHAGRSVDVNDIAKHGFDLRRRMGTTLKPKFSFKTVDGIRRAYKAAFGDLGGLEKILGAKLLDQLENTRHVVVHRGGIADREYADRARLPPSRLNKPIKMDTRVVSAHVNIAVIVGRALIDFVDHWLWKHPPRAKRRVTNAENLRALSDECPA